MQADYVIVGAGSAGCAMAYRLSEAGHSVIVIEFGGSDAGPLIQMPGALSYPMNMPRYDWGYWSEPEPHLGGRQLACPRGKVIGGSSSINGMVYVRGHARDLIRGPNWGRMVGPMPMCFLIIYAKKVGHLRDMAVIPNGVEKRSATCDTRQARQSIGHCVCRGGCASGVRSNR